MTSSSETKISGLWQALANASSAVTQSPCTSLPHIEIRWGLTRKVGGAPTAATCGRAAARALRGEGSAPRLGACSGMLVLLLLLMDVAVGYRLDDVPGPRLCVGFAAGRRGLPTVPIAGRLLGHVLLRLIDHRSWRGEGTSL